MPDKPKRKWWKILVVWKNGEEEYIKNGRHVAVFASRSQAEEVAEGFKMGMDVECQSVNVVRA